ncbi:CGI-121-domain-containing protein, partial [Peniophora sp. CONT]
METFIYSHLDLSVHIALFRNVSNSSQIRQRIIAAATSTGEKGDTERERLNFAFVDARLITSVLHLQTAVYQAILAEKQGALRTKTVHSEILFALNPSNNITEAIRRYGVSDTTSALIVVRVASPDLSDVEGKMKAVVTGDLESLSTLQENTDWAAVKKYNKLNGEPAIKEAGKDVTRERLIVNNIVTSMVAMKSVM